MKQFFLQAVKTGTLVFVIVWSFFAALFVGLLVIMFLGLGLGLAATDSTIVSEFPLEYSSGDITADNQIVSVPINGVILGEKIEADVFTELFSEVGVTYGYEVKQHLQNLAKNDDVAGIVLEIHSPGGTLYGTQAIVDGVAEYKESTGKPVYAYIGSIAASGGYWAAISADKVVADTGTTIGSIGVIMGPFKYYDQVISESGGLFGTSVDTINGVYTDYITSGTSKDLGNPYRQMTDQERQILQTGADQAYQLFVDYVAQQRQISSDQVKGQIGAMVFGEQQAEERKLIDSIGSKDNAYMQLATELGIEKDYKIMKYTDPTDFMSSLLASYGSIKGQIGVGPTFCHQPVAMVYLGNPAVYCP
jgi:protease-4